MAELDVGSKFEVSVQVTDKMVHQFAEMSGDHNPIHLDDAYAAKTRFKKRIAHGMIVGALISRSLVDSIGKGGIYLSQSMKFVNPVFIDDTVIIQLRCTGIRKESHIATIETNVVKTTGEMVVKGEAVILVGTENL